MSEFTEVHAKSLGYRPDELRWRLLRAALQGEWQGYERVRRSLNAIGMDIPARGELRQEREEF